MKFDIESHITRGQDYVLLVLVKRLKTFYLRHIPTTNQHFRNVKPQLFYLANFGKSSDIPTTKREEKRNSSPFQSYITVYLKDFFLNVETLNIK